MAQEQRREQITVPIDADLRAALERVASMPDAFGCRLADPGDRPGGGEAAPALTS